MAKKKKHKLSKSKHNKVVKNTTINKPSNLKTNHIQQKDSAIEKIAHASDSLSSKEKGVIADVKFSLALLGIIIGAFVLLYILLQNKSISDQVYGIIKINF